MAICFWLLLVYIELHSSDSPQTSLVVVYYFLLACSSSNNNAVERELLFSVQQQHPSPTKKHMLCALFLYVSESRYGKAP